MSQKHQLRGRGRPIRLVLLQGSDNTRSEEMGTTESPRKVTDEVEYLPQVACSNK